MCSLSTLVASPLLDSLISLIASYAGLRLSQRDLSMVAQVVQQRMTDLKLSGLDDYYALLARDAAANQDVPAASSLAPSRQEWQRLLTHLTVGESYFLRDEKQLNLLRYHLLPDRLQAAASGCIGSPLRLWSAGCATGEEAYSLAILLQEMGVSLTAGQARIVGTDINPVFLTKARGGLYGPWSFRQMSRPLQQTYFAAEPPERWRVRPDLQSSVDFQSFNLVHDPIARLVGNGPRFDVIVCRNVFIYFTPDAIAATLAKFYEALTPGGYLITGHAELQGIPLGSFQVRSFPESIVYQRPLSPQSLPASPAFQSAYTGAGRPTGTAPKPLSALPHRPTRLPRTAPSPAPSPHPSSDSGSSAVSPSLLQTAQALANAGQHSAAQALCEQAMRGDPLATEPCYLLAHIAEETGDLDRAKGMLKRVIYLNPQAVAAYLDLAALYDRTVDPERAAKTRRSALAILSQLPPDQTLDTCDGLTVTQLHQQLQAKLL